MADTNKTFGVNFLPALSAFAVLCVAAAAGLYLLGSRDSTQGADQLRQINELVALSQKIPSQATGALSGNTAAFDALATSSQRYARVAEAIGPEAQTLGASTELLK